MTQKKPRLGVLALMLEDYLPLFPGIDRAQTAYVNEVLDGLRDAAEFVFPHAAMSRIIGRSGKRRFFIKSLLFISLPEQ